MPREKQARYVCGPTATSGAARNVLNSQQQESQATIGSQPMPSQEKFDQVSPPPPSL